MKRTLSFILSLIMVIGVIVSVPITVSSSEADNLIFELNEDGASYSVKGAVDETVYSVIIPSTYNDLPVTSIGERAFSKCENLSVLVINEGIKEIGKTAFFSLPALTAITFPRSLEKIDAYAFAETIENLKYIYYNGSVEQWKNLDVHETNVNCPGVKISKHLKECTISPIPDCHIIKEVVIVPNDTKKDGLKIKQCVVCGEVYEETVLPQTLPRQPETPIVKRIHNGIYLEWGYDYGTDYYIVYRKTAKTSWQRIAKIKGYPEECNCITDCYCSELYAEASFTDTKVKSGTTYYYTIKAENEVGYSTYNKTGVKIKYVTAPVLTKIANEASGVRVYWNKVSGADGYYLYRRVSGTKSWTRIATIKKGSTTSYKDTKATAGKTYDYIIKAYDGSTVSAAAEKVIRIKRLTQPKLVSVSSSKSGVTVKWGKVAGAESYYVYRKTSTGSWQRMTIVDGNAKVSFVDKTAKKGVTYTYTVRAYSGSYKSSYNSKGLKIKDKY